MKRLAGIAAALLLLLDGTHALGCTRIAPTGIHTGQPCIHLLRVSLVGSRALRTLLGTALACCRPLTSSR